MFLVGLTGGIASGKSTVTRLFRELGCPCIDADLIAREVVEPSHSQPAYHKIKETFGDTVFHNSGELNRERLGQIIFNDPDKRSLLNSIVHPAIKKRMLWQIFLHFIKGYQFVLVDVPLLFETKQMLPYMTYTIVVSCLEDQQLNRLMARNSLSEEDAKARIKSQLPLNSKCSLCTDIIDNSRDMAHTKDQVKKLYSKLQSSKKHLFLRFGLLALLIAIVGGVVMLSKKLQLY